MWKFGPIGIQEIDEEHRVLFECLGSIYASIGSDLSHAVAFNTLEKLDEYSRTHFRVEECLMRVFRYPELESHRREHEKFIAKIDELRQKLLKDNEAESTVPQSMVHFLGNWLLNHIQQVDTRYVAYFKSTGLPELEESHAA